MPIVNAQNMSASQITGIVQEALSAHRAALERVNDLFAWTSGIGAADLEAAPISMPAADAGALLSAIADAHAEYQLHTTGLPPATYPQPAQAFVYGASQTAVLGPLA